MRCDREWGQPSRACHEPSGLSLEGRSRGYLLLYHHFPALAMASAKSIVNCKLLLIGNSSVGKSSLLMRFSDEQWLPEDEASATIGVDFRVSGQRPVFLASVALVAYHPCISGTQDGG